MNIQLNNVNRPLVTVIVPIYKVEKYIGYCAESLFAQSYSEIEYIFVNDCTPDKSVDIVRAVLEKYPERKLHVRFINNMINQGLAYCRNIGVSHAQGEYLMHVDSDDYVAKDAVENLLGTALRENADIVVSNFFLVTQTGIKNDILAYPDDKDIYLKKILQRDLRVGVCGKFLKRKLYTEHGIEVPAGIDFGEDMVTFPRLVYYANKIALSSPFYYYNQLNIHSYTKHVGEKTILSVIRTEQVLREFFRDKFEKDTLENLLDVYRQKMRAELLFNTSPNLRKKYRNLFYTKDLKSSLFPYQQRILMWLMQNKAGVFSEGYMCMCICYKRLKKYFI